MLKVRADDLLVGGSSNFAKAGASDADDWRPTIFHMKVGGSSPDLEDAYVLDTQIELSSTYTRYINSLEYDDLNRKFIGSW